MLDYKAARRQSLAAWAKRYLAQWQRESQERRRQRSTHSIHKPSTS